MANECSIQQKAITAVGCRPIVCPKPRRLYLPADTSDPRSATDLLDALFHKQSDSSPHFSGSPPRRSGNPMVHDARFGEANPFDHPSILIPIAGSGSAMARKVCARSRYSLSPAVVRIEGFDCLDRSRGIQAVA